MTDYTYLCIDEFYRCQREERTTKRHSMANTDGLLRGQRRPTYGMLYIEQNAPIQEIGLFSTPSILICLNILLEPCL